MAKQDDTVEFGEINLDDLDFDSLDFGDPFQTDNKPKSAPREAITEFVSGATNVVKDRVLDRNTIRRLVSGSLHKGYTQAFNAYDAIESGLSDIMKDHANDLNPMLMSLKRRTDRWGPMAKRFLPRFIREGMDDAELTQSWSGGDQAPSELSINLAGLDKLFAQQADQVADNNIREAVQQSREQKRFLSETATQLEIGRGIGRLVGYQDTVLINYHRKSLEIGYRQLDVAVRMLQLQQLHFHKVDEILPDILKNTGLPDFIKMRHTEVLKQQMANKLASSVIGSVGNWASNFFTGVKKNASDMLGEFLQFKSMAESNVTPGMTRAGAFGQAAGAFVGTYAADAAEEILHEISKTLKPMLEKIPGYTDLGERARRMFTGIPQRINEWVKSDTDRDDIFGFAEEGLKSLFDTFSAQSTIQGHGSMNLDKPAAFDNLFHRSVTEVIPGYLASIDKWMRAVATGEEQEEMAYSHYTGGMVSKSTLEEQHVRIALKDNSGKALRQELDALLRDLGGSNLSAEAKRALRKRLLKDMANGNMLKPERYTNLDTWSQLPGTVANEIIEFIAEKFGVEPDGTLNQSAEQKAFHNDIGDKYDAAQRRVPEFGKRMDILKHYTGRRVWRDLGFTKYNGIEGDNIDLDALYDRLVNDGDDFDPAEIPPTDKEALKEYNKRKKKAEEELLRYGIGNNDKVDVDNSKAKSARRVRIGPGPGPIPPDTGPTPPLPDPTPPAPITVNVPFPDPMKTVDEQTHARLDQLLQAFDVNNNILDAILQFLPTVGQQRGDGGGGPGPGPGPMPPDPTPPLPPAPGGGRIGSRLLKGAGWVGRKLYGGLDWYFRNSFKAIGWAGSTAARGLVGAVKFPFKSRHGLGISDIFIAGSQTPAMLARDIRQGLYIDVLTNKVISKLKDITGPVRDMRDGNLVITQDDFNNGLYSGEGESLAAYLGRGAASAVGLLAGGASWWIRKTYGLMWKAAKKVGSTLLDQFTQFDAYFPGDDEPRISSKKMKRGFYRNKDGAPIMSLKDIIGPVFDIDGNEIISEEEIAKYKSLYARNGSLLFTFGRGLVNATGRAFDLAMAGAKWYGRQVGKFYRGMWRGVKAIGRGIGRGVKGMFGRGVGHRVDDDDHDYPMGGFDGELAETSVEIQGRQLDAQLDILRILKDSFDKAPVKGDVDGDGEREFSWRDILRRRKEAAGGPVSDGSADVVEAINKLGDRLDDQFEELIETTEEAGETGLLEDLADMAGIAGGGGNGGRRRRRRRGGGPGMGRKMWDAVKTGVGVLVGSTVIRAGGMALLSGLGTVAGALFTGPGLVVAAVVAGTAYVGYRWYKSSKAKEFPLLYLRMTQYGISPTDKDNVEKMLALEEMCSRSVTVGADGVANMTANGIDMARVSSMFTLDSQARIEKFAEWVSKRFRPVYLAHVVAMKRIRNTTSLESADKGIDASDIETYLQTVDLPNMQEVYDNEEISPFDGDVDTDASDVEDAFQLVRDSAKKRKTQEVTSKPVSESGRVVGLGLTAVAGAAAARNSIVAVNAKGTDDPAKIAEGLKIATMVRGGVAATSYNGTATTPKALTSLNIPTAVRYKTYGLKEMELLKCVQLQQVEDVYWEVVTYSGTSKAGFSVDQEKLKQKVLDIFKPADEVEKLEVTRWLEYRFIPTFLQYCISVRRRYNGDARDGWRNLTGPQMKEVLDETTRATVEYEYRTRSVWEILNSPWRKYDLETMVGVTKLYIDSLDTGDNNKVLDVQGLATQQRTNPENSDYGTLLTNTALGNTRANPVGPGVGYNGSTLSNMAGIYGGTRTAGGAAGQGSGGGDGSMLLTGSYGNQVEHPGGGKGGDINMLPNNRGDGLEQMGPIITGAAEMVGFDPKIALNVAAAESGLRPKASSGIAFGLFQFIQGTWDSMLAKYGPTYGIAPGTPPTDPRANAILGICYLKENYQGLSGALGNNITDLDLYMSHFLGLSGAKRFLTAPRQDMAYKHVGNGSERPWKKKGDGGNTVTGMNASIFFKDYGKTENPQQHRNVGEILQEMDRRMNIGRKKAGNPPSRTSAGEPPVSSVPSTGSTVAGAAGGSAAGSTDPAGVVSAGGMSTPDGGMGGGGVKEGSQTPTATAATVGGAAGVASQTAPAAGSPGPAITPPQVSTPAPKPEVPPFLAPLPEGQRPSAETYAAAQAAQTASADTPPVDMGDTNTILDKQLEAQAASTAVLEDIRNLLAANKQGGGSGGGTPAQPQPSSGPSSTEPLPKRPVVNQRKYAEN